MTEARMRTPYAGWYAIILVKRDTDLNKHVASGQHTVKEVLGIYARCQTNSTERCRVLWLCRMLSMKVHFCGRVWHDMGPGIRIML